MKIDITISVEGSTQADALQNAAALLQALQGGTPAPATGKKQSKQAEVLATFSNGEKVATGSGPGAAPAPVVAQPAAAPAAEPEVDPITGEAVAAAPVVSYDDAKNACVSVSNKLGRDACVKLLKEFGAAKVPDLRPDQYAPIFHKAQALLAGK